MELMNLANRSLPIPLPILKNGVFLTLPPTPTSNVTRLNRSRPPRLPTTKSSVFLITRSLSAAVDGDAEGGGSETTRIRSIGVCGKGGNEFEGWAVVICGIGVGVGGPGVGVGECTSRKC